MTFFYKKTYTLINMQTQQFKYFDIIYQYYNVTIYRYYHVIYQFHCYLNITISNSQPPQPLHHHYCTSSPIHYHHLTISTTTSPSPLQSQHHHCTSSPIHPTSPSLLHHHRHQQSHSAKLVSWWPHTRKLGTFLCNSEIVCTEFVCSRMFVMNVFAWVCLPDTLYISVKALVSGNERYSAACYLS